MYSEPLRYLPYPHSFGLSFLQDFLPGLRVLDIVGLSAILTQFGHRDYLGDGAGINERREA